MKKVRENLSYSEFEEFVRKFEEEIFNVEGVVNILTSDIDEEIPHSNGVFRREYWGKGKRGSTKIKKDLLYSKDYSLEYETDTFNIYEYED